MADCHQKRYIKYTFSIAASFGRGLVCLWNNVLPIGEYTTFNMNDHDTNKNNFAENGHD